MKKSKLILTTLILDLPVVSLATDYSALGKELSAAESSSQSNFSGGNAMQQGFSQQKQQNIGWSIYDQNRESISQNQQRNNIKTTYFGNQQGQQNSDRSIYDQNRGYSQS